MVKICNRCGSLGEDSCPSCSVRDTMIEINTPIGKELYHKYYDEKKSTKVANINITEEDRQKDILKQQKIAIIVLIIILVFTIIMDIKILSDCKEEKYIEIHNQNLTLQNKIKPILSHTKEMKEKILTLNMAGYY